MIVARATGYEIDHCMGCLDSLFQTKATPLSGDKKVPVQVLTSDAGKLVAAHIDEMKFKDVLKETIPNTNDLKEIYSAPALDCKLRSTYEIDLSFLYFFAYGELTFLTIVINTVHTFR